MAPVLDNTDRPFPLSQKVLLDCAALKRSSFVLGVILCREGDESLLPPFLPPIGQIGYGAEIFVDSFTNQVLETHWVVSLLPTVLESWLDYTGELEPPEPLARLPQLKHCIKQLLTDLGKVQQIALCCST